MAAAPEVAAVHEQVLVTADRAVLQGNLDMPADALGVVLFAHGSGSGRHSPRNRFVALQLQEAGLGTLLVDLLTEHEEAAERYTAHLRFNIEMLANRLVGAIDWLGQYPDTADLPVGLFGASTGGGAALVAAARRTGPVAAVVSRGGRPDLARGALPHVKAPTLLIVGGYDDVVIEMNESALKQLRTPHKNLIIVAGASHLFEEPGKLEEVARLAGDWFRRHLRR